MYKRGNSWVSEFWWEGNRYKKSWGAITKTVAREKDEKFKTEVREGKHERKAKRMLFEAFAKKYLEHAELNKKAGSFKRNESSINMLMPHFKGKPFELYQSVHG